MKNIHILPTDKPSRLRIGDNGNVVFGMIQTSIQSRNDNFTNQHIYITSDEEIKEGDWYLTKHNELYKSKVIGTDNNGFHFCKKIILTTDPDLIANGVQPIDDEFLEWFVKNPSCEFVKVNHYGTCCGNQLVKQCIDCKKYNPIYKIIIPQEEPKPIHEQIIDIVGGEDRFKELVGLNSKQETLEEAAENEASIFYEKGTIEWNKYRQVFELGANWKAERMYSEEEVENILIEYVKTNPTKPYRVISWFKQFKKK